MNPRAAAVAFAASALFAAPALADPGHKDRHDSNNLRTSGALHVDLGNGLGVSLAGDDWALTNHHGAYGHSRYGNNRYQSRYEIRKLRRRAVRACNEAVKYEARELGFRRVYLDDVERIRQIGPKGFKVRAEFEFDTRRGDFERDVTCIVRRGRVVRVDGLPRARRYRNRDYDYRDDGYRNGGYRNHDDDYDGYRGNDHLKGARRPGS